MRWLTGLSAMLPTGALLFGAPPLMVMAQLFSTARILRMSCMLPSTLVCGGQPHLSPISGSLAYRNSDAASAASSTFQGRSSSRSVSMVFMAMPLVRLPVGYTQG